MKAQQEWANNLVGDGWFHEDGKDAVLGVLNELIALGVPEETARGMIEQIITAARSEYGE